MRVCIIYHLSYPTITCLLSCRGYNVRGMDVAAVDTSNWGTRDRARRMSRIRLISRNKLSIIHPTVMRGRPQKSHSCLLFVCLTNRTEGRKTDWRNSEKYHSSSPPASSPGLVTLTRYCGMTGGSATRGRSNSSSSLVTACVLVWGPSCETAPTWVMCLCCATISSSLLLSGK